MNELPGPWTKEHTMAFLNSCPLPPSFKWKHRDGGLRPVCPSHRSVIGYGKWLREAPYFRGLFDLIHEVLQNAPELGGPEWLAEEVNKMKLREEQGKLNFNGSSATN